MELRQLEYFVAVAEELHFSNAAKRLNMTQPPLSQQIQRLEDEFGLKLFDRSKRSVTLTPAGRVLYENATALLDRARLAKKLCRQTHSGKAGEFAVGVMPIALELKVLKEIEKFRTRFPDVRLTLHEMGSTSQLTALQEGKTHVGFVQACGYDQAEFDSHFIQSETYWLAIPEKHDIAQYSRVPIDALEGVNIILPPLSSHPDMINGIASSCRQAGFEPRIDIEVVGHHSALALVSAGAGVTPAPRSCTKLPFHGVVFRPVSAAWPKMEIHMVWRRLDEDPILRNFIEVVAGR